MTSLPAPPATYFTNIRGDMLALVPRRRYARILEVGGGEFPTLRHLAAEHGAEAVGVDVYRPTTDGIRFIQGSIEDDAVTAQLPDGAFDLILGGDVIEHLVGTEAVFATFFRTMAPGGVLILSIPNVRQIRTFYYLFVKGTFPRWPSGLFDRTHLRWFCRRDVVAMLEAAGFERLRVRGTGRFRASGWRIPLVSELLALQFIYVFRKPA
jgi:SAM-dependent methyltransferase